MSGDSIAGLVVGVAALGIVAPFAMKGFKQRWASLRRGSAEAPEDKSDRQ